MSTCYCSKIAVLQFLSESDKKTGKKLFDDIEILESFYQRGIEIKYYELNSKQEFLTCLRELEKTAELGEWPILHIECHGSDNTEGIILADNTFLSWIELKPYFININKASRFNLIIVLAACNGAYLAKTLSTIDRAPCWALIGPTDKVYPDELLRDFTGFYQCLLNTLNGDKALNLLAEIPLKIGGYHITTSTNFFIEIYAGFIEEFATPKKREKRAKEIFRKYKNQVISPKYSVGYFKRYIKKWHKDFLIKHLNYFFMLDIYPENRERFFFDFEKLSK